MKITIVKSIKISTIRVNQDAGLSIYSNCTLSFNNYYDVITIFADKKLLLQPIFHTQSYI